MANRGKNSGKHDLWKKQRYLAKTFTFQWAFQDRLIKETVCTSTADEINKFLKEQCSVEEPQQFFPEEYIDGMVLRSQIEVAYWDNSLPPVPLLKEEAEQQ